MSELLSISGLNKLNVSQLKEALTSKNVKFTAKMSKSNLVKLLQDACAPVSQDMDTLPLSNPEGKLTMDLDPMTQAENIIIQVVRGWSDLETLSRNEILNEVAISMGDEFVSSNRKKLIEFSVGYIQDENARRNEGGNEQEEEHADEPEATKEPEATVETELVTEPEVAIEEEPAMESEMVNEKTDVAEEEMVITPKKKRGPKAKTTETKPEAVDMEQMTINQIRELLEKQGMEKMLNNLNTLVKQIAKKTNKKEVKPRKPNVFNLYMKEEMARLKELYPERGHKALFSMASGLWKTSEKNPKRVAAEEDVSQEY